MRKTFELFADYHQVLRAARAARAYCRPSGTAVPMAPEYAERAPRVGDTTPPGIPLYDLPPCYGAHYPPFRRGDDDAPPRRFYGEPW